MYKILLLTGFCLASYLMPVSLSAQIWPFKKKGQAERATRDLDKRQRETGQANAFNPLQPMGSSLNNERNDYIWSSETAYITNLNSGNVSLTTPSRLGFHPNAELQSLLGSATLVPNLMLKRRLHSGKWLFATRHGIYTPTPGLKWAQKQKYHSIADTTLLIPHIFTVRNELLVSKPFFDPAVCDAKVPYLVISASLAFDYGFPFKENNLVSINEHILGSRSPGLTGNGPLLISRLRVDARITDYLFLEGGVRYFIGNMPNNGFEHHASLNYFLFRSFTVSPGYILSVGDFGNSGLQIFPFFDMTYYFGKKSRRPSGLF
jgi:hypothetical protein